MKWIESMRTLDTLTMRDGRLKVWLKLQKSEAGDCKFTLNYESVDKDMYDTINGFETIVFSKSDMRNNDRILQVARTLSTMMPSNLNSENMPIRGIMQYMDRCYFDVADFIEMVYQFHQRQPQCEHMFAGLMLNLPNFMRGVHGVKPRVEGPRITLLSDFMSYILWWGENEAKENLSFGTHREHSICLAGVLDLLAGHGAYLCEYDDEDIPEEPMNMFYDEEDEDF